MINCGLPWPGCKRHLERRRHEPDFFGDPLCASAQAVDAGDEIDAADGGFGSLRLGAGLDERGCAVSEDLEFVRSIVGTVPMRTAAEQWALAGHPCGVYAVLHEDGIVFIDGVGGRCCMKQDQWAAYVDMCHAPTISMRAVEAEEERQWDNETLRPGETPPAAEDLQRIYGALETSLTEVTEYIMAAQQTVREDDHDEALAVAVRRLRLCIGTVGGLKKGGAQ